jgi:SAM-dependent methyltransferase
LIVNRHWGIPLADLFTTHRDGLESESVYRMCGPLQKFLPPFLSLVSIPTWLARNGNANSIYEDKRLANDEKARFILQALFGRLRRALEKLKPANRKGTAWSGYMETHTYTGAEFATKENFIKQVLSEFKPKQVLDVGTNTGHFGVLAAAAGAQVVAIDSDAACIGSLWQQAFAKNLNLLPLVIDLARPSAALGWRNGECQSFLERAAGAFDAVFMLAVLHHLMVTERVPLDEVLALAAELMTDLLVIEFVAPEDEMFRQLARGRDHLFAGLNQEVFETACRKHFEIVRAQPLGEHRRVYLLRKVSCPR